MRKITSIYLLIMFVLASTSLFAQIATNDTCAGAIDLGTLTSPISGTTTNATNNYTNGCLNPLAPDIVYFITVPANFKLTINQPDNSYDSVVRIAYGDTCPGDTEIDCFDDPDLLINEWTNDTGWDQTVYWVQSGFNNHSGTFELAWSLTSTLGVDNYAFDTFKFYPNPTTDTINLSASAQIDKVFVYNLLGQKVFDQTIGDISSTLSIANLSNGTYIMEVSINGESRNFKIIKNQ